MAVPTKHSKRVDPANSNDDENVLHEVGEVEEMFFLEFQQAGSLQHIVCGPLLRQFRCSSRFATKLRAYCSPNSAAIYSLPTKLQQAPNGSATCSVAPNGPRVSLSSFYGSRRSKNSTDSMLVGKQACVWDESVLEKPESLKLEGLCAVKSSTAARLKRIKPGFYNPPGGRPIFVPGMQWLSALLMGPQGIPQVAVMQWWTTRGRFKQGHRDMHLPVLERMATSWGDWVIHAFDRGWAGNRGYTSYKRCWCASSNAGLSTTPCGTLPRERSVRHGKSCAANARGIRRVWDAHQHRERQMGVVVASVRHPDYVGPLFLVVARSGGGREPWYLLTNKVIRTPEDAWRVVFAYARRWQIEMCFRYGKSELAMESPRLWDWESRLKLLLLVTLAYAFLLSLLHDAYETVREWLLDEKMTYRS